MSAAAVLERVLNVPVVLGTVPPAVPDAVFHRVDPAQELTASERRAVLRVQGVAAFYVEDGARVTVEPATESDNFAINTYLYGTVTALLLAQRGMFALHASVARIDGRTVAIGGGRGAGKSTTVLALERRGHAVVSDDVAVIDIAGDHLVHRPTGRPVHVHPVTALALGVDTTGAVPVQRGDPKVSLPLERGTPCRLDEIVLLRAVAVTELHVRARDRRYAVPVITRNVFRLGMLRQIYQPALFAWAAAVADRAPVHVLHRPRGPWTADRVAATVETLVAAGAARSA
jgi:predicted ATPase